MRDWEAINRYDIISILTLCKNGKIGLTESADILMMQRQSEIKKALNEQTFDEDLHCSACVEEKDDILNDRGIK